MSCGEPDRFYRDFSASGGDWRDGSDSDTSPKATPRLSEEPAEEGAEEEPRINVVYDLGNADTDDDDLTMFERWSGRRYEVSRASEATASVPESRGVVDIDAWLQKYRPSRYLRDVRYKALYIGKMAQAERHDFGKFEKLDEAWEELKKSKRPINFFTVSAMAKNCRVVRGKWMAFFDDDASIDLNWRIVARAIYRGELGPYTVAKVKQIPDATQPFLLTIFNKDYTNESDIRKLESQMRDVGLDFDMFYKPDAYSRLVINRKNPWNMRPSLYRSNYDPLSQRSKVIKFK